MYSRHGAWSRMGGGMGRDESALMFCKILPSSSILSCFLCLYLFLTGGERMFSLKKSFLELQKSYKVSCIKLTFRLKIGHILFASSLKLWSSSMLPKILFFSLGPIIQQYKAESTEAVSLAADPCTEEEQLPAGSPGQLQLGWALSLTPQSPWPQVGSGQCQHVSWPTFALLDVELWIPYDILSLEPLRYGYTVLELLSGESKLVLWQAGHRKQCSKNAAVRVT